MIPSGAVVDASVAVKWVIGEPGCEIAVLLRESRLFAPDLWSAECSNVLWKKTVCGELTTAEAEVAAMALESADVELVPTRPLMARAVTLAARLNHLTYDSFYLLIAESLSLPLVTADMKLVETVRHAPSGLLTCTVLPLDELLSRH